MKEMILSLALSTGDPVENGATPAITGQIIPQGDVPLIGGGTKEFELTYWGVLLCASVFPHHNFLSLKICFFFCVVRFFTMG